MQKNLAGSGAHADIDAHIIDLGRYLVGEFTEVCGMMETFIRRASLDGAGQRPSAPRRRRQNGNGHGR